MRPKAFTVSASAGGLSHSAIYIPDRHVTPFNVGFQAVVPATAHFTIQHTFDDPQLVSAGGLHWFNHQFVASASAAVNGNYAFPVAGIRVEIEAANVSADKTGAAVSVYFIQAGIVS